MINWNVTFDDKWPASLNLNATNLNASQNGKSLRELLTSAVKAAGEKWGKYLNSTATIDVQLTIDDSIGGGGSAVGGTTIGRTTILHPFLLESYAAHKISTGEDLNGNTPDIVIGLRSDLLKSHLWFDPATLPADKSGVLSQADAASVFAHEIGHALAFFGLRETNTTLNPAGSLTQSHFDEHVTGNAPQLFFDGQNADFVYGGKVPLNHNSTGETDRYHLADYRFPMMTSDATVNSNVLHFASTDKISVGMIVGTSDTKDGKTIIPDGTTVTAVTPNTVELSNSIAGPGITKGLAVNFDSTSLMAPILANDLLEGSHFRPSFIYDVSSLDLAVLADTGLPVDSPLGKLNVGIAGSSRNVHLPANQWFSAQDPDKEPITWYSIRDITANPNTGHFSVPNGYILVNDKSVPVSGERPAGETTYVQASEFAKVSFVTGTAPGASELWFSASDGHIWGPPEHFTFTTIA